MFFFFCFKTIRFSFLLEVVSIVSSFFLFCDISFEIYCNILFLFTFFLSSLSTFSLHPFSFHPLSPSFLYLVQYFQSPSSQFQSFLLFQFCSFLLSLFS